MTIKNKLSYKNIIAMIMIGMGCVAFLYSGDLVISIENKTKRKGALYLSLFNEARAKDFKNDNADQYSMQGYYFRDVGAKDVVKFTVHSLPAGKYAFKYFLDEDGNAEPKVNALGLPVEKVGFSKRNPAAGHPDFDDVEISIGKDDVVTIERTIK
ncbi:hypothetical protein COTS27_00270 [Spirochaetota bacterium]|nr:hypothetical protein COTS27_00270 [Spirochaetota bacterium]